LGFIGYLIVDNLILCSLQHCFSFYHTGDIHHAYINIILIDFLATLMDAVLREAKIQQEKTFYNYIRT
jgi:hypothetical protein